MKRFTEALKGTLSFLTFAAIVVAFVYFASVTASQNKLLEEQVSTAQRTETALCIFVDDLERRIDDSKEFLIENPNGIEGISAEQIQQSIDNQERTVTALSLLRCTS